MKQIVLTAQILEQLKASLGVDAVDASQYAVYEAVALNTMPVRKRHPLYFQGRHTTKFLEDMAAQLSKESLPLQIQHNTDDLPTGRIFAGQVVANSTGADLRVMFWVDKTNAELVAKIDSGTIDQVSVSVLPQTAKCSECSFDFLGEEATYEQLWSGTCPKGHTMGQSGAHAVMDSLAGWFEMSLVGRGGAQGARILGQTQRRLAADGSDLTPLTLNYAIAKDSKMDMTEFLAKLTATTEEAARLKVEKEQLTASVATLTEQVTTLSDQLVELQAKLDVKPALPAEFSEIVRLMATLTGDVTADLPTEAPALKDFATSKLDALKAKLLAQPKTLSAIDGAAPVSASAFKTRK
jgi:hypothetical protein